MADKDVTELLRKLQDATTHKELRQLGAQFAAPYGNLLVYKHPDLGDKRIFFKKENVEGELTLIYDAIQ